MPLPSGRRVAAPRDHDAATTGTSAGERGRPLLFGPLLLLAIAIGCYVAAEIGVSILAEIVATLRKERRRSP